MFSLILWPAMIYLAYRFALLNINHTEEKENSDSNT